MDLMKMINGASRKTRQHITKILKEEKEYGQGAKGPGKRVKAKAATPAEKKRAAAKKKPATLPAKKAVTRPKPRPKKPARLPMSKKK